MSSKRIAAAGPGPRTDAYRKRARRSGMTINYAESGGSSDEDFDTQTDLGLAFRSDDEDDDGEDQYIDDQEVPGPAPSSVPTMPGSSAAAPRAGASTSGGPKLVLSSKSKQRYAGDGRGCAGSGGGGGGGGQRSMPHRPADLATALFPKTDFSTFLTLKPDHASRPLYINPDSTGSIILEAFHPLAPQAQDFLIAIAEPVSRPAHIHEYKLTMFSLYAAVSVGLDREDIIEVLNKLSKTPVSESLASFIRDSTASYGKVKLVLKKNRYWVESSSPEVLRLLLRDPVIAAARAHTGDDVDDGDGAVHGMERDKAPKRGGLIIPGTAAAKAAAAGQNPAAAASEEGQEGVGVQTDADLFGAIVGIHQQDALDEDDTVHAFEILESHVESVKRRCNELDYPMLEEYAFRDDIVNPDLEIDPKPTTTIRPYQEKCLSRVFSNGRARSGIIVLPCGAGKTLVGIVAACTINKSCLILCTSGVSVMQWKQQFLQWSTIKERQISVFTADQKERFQGAAGIVISTYSMVSNRQKRSHDAAKMMEFLTNREWGLILLDEVHVVPASMFRQVVSRIKAHAKLGLTATLVREDEKIADLNFLIGPKLYEANWMDLASQGHIANVQCAEVWCPMTPEFHRQYLREKTRKKMLLYCMNPAKFQACQFLIDYHEKRGDKVIVFSDNVYALEAYAKKLGKRFIHGGTQQAERIDILQRFQASSEVQTIFLSKVGDTSIDLPEATCLIQISSHFGSRRQEAQRLGRVLRAKRRNEEGFNAFFYSLISQDTQELYYSTKRQQFLVDQGYAFKVITHLEGMQELPDLVYPTKNEQIELLQTVLLADETDADTGSDLRPRDGDSRSTGTGKSAHGPGAKKGAATERMTGSLNMLSGGSSMAYMERNRSANKRSANDEKRHKLFKRREKEMKERRKEGGP